MASTRLTQTAYDAVKRVAEERKTSIVAWASEVLLREATAELARIIEEVKTKEAERIAGLEAFIGEAKPKVKPKRKGGGS